MSQPKWLGLKGEILDEEMRRKKAKLEETLMRAFERVPDEEEPAIYKCPRCQDAGVVMMTEGTFDVGGVRGSMDYAHGKHKVVMATATPEKPIFVRCLGCNRKKDPQERQKGGRKTFGDDS